MESRTDAAVRPLMNSGGHGGGEGQTAFLKPRQEPWELGEDFLVIKVSDGDYSFVTA